MFSKIETKVTLKLLSTFALSLQKIKLPLNFDSRPTTIDITSY